MDAGVRVCFIPFILFSFFSLPDFLSVVRPKVQRIDNAIFIALGSQKLGVPGPNAQAQLMSILILVLGAALLTQNIRPGLRLCLGIIIVIEESIQTLTTF